MDPTHDARRLAYRPIHTRLVHIRRPTLSDLHPVPEVCKVLVRALALLCDEPVAFDPDAEIGRELQRDAEQCTLRHLVEAHLV